MEGFIVEKKGKLGKKKYVLISGLPGIANVSKIAVDYLSEKIKAKEVFSIYSYYFPNSVVIDKNNLVHLPKVSIKKGKLGKKDLLLLTGDVQPTDDKSYMLTELILDLVEKNVKEIITLGGIGLKKLPKEIKVHVALNDEKLKEKLKNIDVVFDGNKTVGLIIGVAGLLLGLSKLRKIPAFSLLVETLGMPMYIGLNEARILLSKLSSYLNEEIDLSGLEGKIKEVREIIKKVKRREKRRIKEEAKKVEKSTKYIG